MASTETPPLKEESLRDLDSRLLKQIEVAKDKLDQNPDYTISVCSGILKRHLGCLEVRQILRKAQERMHFLRGGGVRKFLSKGTNLTRVMKLQKAFKDKDYPLVFELGEEILTRDVRHALVHKLFAEAAKACELDETRVFACENVVQSSPSTENKLDLASALIEVGRPKEAILIGEEILKELQAHAKTEDMIRRASVAESMDKGKWEEEGDFRDKLADEKEAVEIEQADRSVKDEDVLEQLTKKRLKELESDPENLSVWNLIINDYRKIGDYAKAIHYIEAALKTKDGASDESLITMQTELRLSQSKEELEAKEAALRQNPENTTLAAEVKTLKADLQQSSIQAFRQLIERYPNNHEARFKLGSALFDHGDYDPAIAEFQITRRSPRFSLSSDLMLGQAFLAKGIYDIAADQFRQVKDQSLDMDEDKKEAIYRLAQCYEQGGHPDKAIEEYKILYSTDINYRDVAQKINASYK